MRRADRQDVACASLQAGIGMQASSRNETFEYQENLNSIAKKTITASVTSLALGVAM
jgi:hypothetical protein